LSKSPSQYLPIILDDPAEELQSPFVRQHSQKVAGERTGKWGKSKADCRHHESHTKKSNEIDLDKFLLESNSVDERGIFDLILKLIEGKFSFLFADELNKRAYIEMFEQFMRFKQSILDKLKGLCRSN